MGHHRIRPGLNLPINGRPQQVIEPGRPVTRVALLADDYVGMKPVFRVQVGDIVRRGQTLFEDKKMPGVLYTSPGAGRVAAIHRGERRAFQSIVIELSEGERAGRPGDAEFEKFGAFSGQPVSSLAREQVKALLIESGLWTSLRGRPFGRVADPQVTPRSIFVTAMDTNPLSADVDVACKGREVDFQLGLELIARLTDGPIFVCRAPQSIFSFRANGKIRDEVFEGPHPAGTVGLHIHLLDPVCRDK
ncbi:MAG TPA: NADH:ubiquinone reductase (Na(+)-transporting) subunit A, partial [Phycisphaerae bacterium]|nr:NADH:ubiquinone reductase (Na(+)-transporting) subunit A [Phycisphaerae bacterium]